MTGILLLGGHGTRLFPCTQVVNKQLLPLYNKPLFFYSLSTLINLGVDNICIIARRQDMSYYKVLWSDGYVGFGIVDHLIANAGQFDVTMIITDLHGCKDTMTYDNMFRINDVDADCQILLSCSVKKIEK